MIDLNALKRAARVITDNQGQQVVQIPITLWNDFVGHSSDKTIPQHERIRAVLADWDAHPDDTPQQWWDEFDKFLRENRLSFEEHDPGLDK